MMMMPTSICLITWRNLRSWRRYWRWGTARWAARSGSPRKTRWSHFSDSCWRYSNFCWSKASCTSSDWSITWTTGCYPSDRNWTVVADFHLAENDEDADDDYVGLKKLSKVPRVHYDVLIAHLFLHITLKVSLYLCKLFSVLITVLTSVYFIYFFV